MTRLQIQHNFQYVDGILKAMKMEIRHAQIIRELVGELTVRIVSRHEVELHQPQENHRFNSR